MRRSTLSWVSVAVLLALAPAAQAAQRPRLTAFSSCRALLRYAHENAARAGGVGVPVRVGTGVVTDVASPTTPAPTSKGDVQEDASSAPTGAAPGFSTTNVQEAGIDEPDLVKTDGRLVYAVEEARLRIVDVQDAAPRLLGTLDLGDTKSHQILLRGTRVLDLAGGGDGLTTLTEIDVSDPAAPKVARTMELPGAYVDARLTGGTARVVVASSPLPTHERPLDAAPVRTFLPATTIRSKLSGRTFRRGVVGCDDVRRPGAFSGLGLVTVLTVDLDKGLYDVDRDAVMAGAETVYASPTALYVASRRFVPHLDDAADVPQGLRTEIHRFTADDDGTTTYAGSGTVPGFVLNTYALSEQDGALRVASTDEPSWLPEARAPTPAQSYVTVLKPGAGGALTQVGQLGGLGEGERIYAVRFVGTTGYVVTFRQVDPLHTLDLSDPAAPRQVGELEIPGYSAYLHPIGDGLLLGIGQEADAAGRVQGTQVSVFDVSDLAHPRRVQHAVYGGGSAGAEIDPHAFVWWAPTQTAILPVWLPDFDGAVALRATAGELRELGRVSPGTADDGVGVDRALVIGDRVYTLSAQGLQASRLDTLAPIALAPFPG